MLRIKSTLKSAYLVLSTVIFAGPFQISSPVLVELVFSTSFDDPPSVVPSAVRFLLQQWYLYFYLWKRDLGCYCVIFETFCWLMPINYLRICNSLYNLLWIFGQFCVLSGWHDVCLWCMSILIACWPDDVLIFLGEIWLIYNYCKPISNTSGIYIQYNTKLTTVIFRVFRWTRQV